MTDPHPAAHSNAAVHHLEDYRPAPPREGPRVSLEKTPASASAHPGQVVEGTVLPAPAEQPEATTATDGPAAVVWARTARTVRVVATHERTRTTGRAVVRHGMYIVSGAGVVAKRAWDGRTAARYERMMRTAEATGQHETALEWEARGAAFRKARHERRMELLTAPQRLAKGALVGAGVTVGGLLTLGTVSAIAAGDASLVLAPTLAVVETIHWLMVIAAVVWGPLLALAPWMGLLGLWAIGRSKGRAPTWTLPAKQRPAAGEEPITPSVVVTALRDLGIAELRKSIKAMGDGGAGMLSPIVLAGCGVEVDALLPSGASTEEVMARRRKLAENLGRHEHEVHPSVAPAARTVRLWIADSGALDEPVPASPLVTDPDVTADYTSGRAPWGLDLRGELAGLSLHQKHLLITGLSNQGKTAALRALALWLALDPTVEFRLADLKGIGDWSMWQGLATVLIEGPTDDHVAQTTEMVEDGVAEMERRLMAPKGTTFPPLVLIVDEAQVAYGSGAIGPDKRPYGGSRATSRYFKAVKAIHDQGRAVNVTIWEGTQDPTNDNLPKRSREGNHIRASLVLGTESQAKMALGETPVDAGAAPHKLRQGLDRGQVVVAGDGVKLPAGQSSINIRTHYINDTEAEEIAERAKAHRSGIVTRSAAEPAAEVDPLADIATVLGSEPRMRTQEVLSQLGAHNASYYREWTFLTLKSFLEQHDAAPYKSDGRMVIDHAKVTRALANQRADNDAESDAA